MMGYDHIHTCKLTAIAGFVAVLLIPALGDAQEGGSCAFLCTPELKIEPTISFENLGSRARVEVGGVVEETQRETVFELLFAVGVPTTIPRVGLTFEAGFAPFETDNLVGLELELNLDLIDSDQTGGWLSSHFDIVDKFSPAERPDATSAYTHKLNFELDTALHLFNSLSEGRWLRNLEIEVSIDYVATGIPKAGDQFGDVLYLDDASPWSLSLVFVFPLAPLNP